MYENLDLRQIDTDFRHIQERPYTVSCFVDDGVMHKAWCRLCGFCSVADDSGVTFAGWRYSAWWEGKAHFCMRGQITLIEWVNT